MSPALFVLVAVCGGLGCVCRFVLDGVIRSRISGGTLPWGTMIINLSGSLLLGLVTGLAAGHVLPETARLAAGVGFLGGYTTFSTASVESVRLLQEHRWRAGLASGLGMLMAGTALAGLGLGLGSLV